MTRLTILAGAFSVGVGFGLQNVFNNFVSGLILLFERPINIGDVVQIDDASGVVERIGVRASIIRTTNGSELWMQIRSDLAIAISSTLAAEKIPIR